MTEPWFTLWAIVTAFLGFAGAAAIVVGLGIAVLLLSRLLNYLTRHRGS
jgi:hypothetical protein